MHELPVREWVAIFYPTTGACRLCPTLDFARNMVSTSTFAKHVYKSPSDFRTRHDHHSLEKMWAEAYKLAAWRLPKTAVGNLEKYSVTPPDTGTEEFCKLLWEFLQDVGDRLSTPQMSGTKAQTKEHYELKLGLMSELIGSEDYKKKYNNQARTVFTALFENGEQFLKEDDIRAIILNLVVRRQLKTKQDPWVVFQYYRPQFIKDGYIVRGRQPKVRG
jgi:hypothetical protein